MHLGSNLTYVQAFNYRIVLNAIRLHGPLSRAEVAKRTELSPQTVSNLVGELLRRKLVTVTGQRQREGGGKPSTLLAINPSGGYSVGLNIYLDNLSGVLIDLAGNVQQQVDYDITSSSPENAIPLMVEMVNDLLTRHGLSRRALLGAGVGLPGAFTATAGEGAKHASFAVWHQPSVLKALERDLDVAVFLENNAKAAALGERWYGRGQTINNFLYVSLGRYLGGAVVINGQIHRGSTGLAGELGDIPVVSAASLGKELADYASPAVLYEALASCGEVVTSPAELQALFNQGHPYILEWLITAAQHLAPTLIVAEYLFDPEAIIFGGRLPPLLLDELIARLEGVMSRYRNKTKQHSPPLIRSDAGEIAAALGAATLPIYDFMAPHPSVLLKQPAGQRVSSAVLTD